MPLVASEPKSAEPAAKLRTFNWLVPLLAAVELVGVKLIPCTAIPAAAFVLAMLMA